MRHGILKTESVFGVLQLFLPVVTKETEKWKSPQVVQQCIAK